jgi:hypothetical protein
MTDLRDKPNVIEHWRATIEALETIVLAENGAPELGAEIDPAEAEEVRHAIMVRIASRRRATLPAAWVRRPGHLDLIPKAPAEPVPEAERAPEVNGRAPDQSVRSRPAWRE